MSTKNYFQVQFDEIETLQCIYDKEFNFINEEERIFEIKLDFDAKYANILFNLPNEYPDSPPICELGIPWIRGQDKNKIENLIQNIACENLGQTVIYQIVECIREELCQRITNEIKEDENTIENPVDIHDYECEIKDVINVFHGEPFVDRKSTFQAHIAKVKNEEEVEQVKRQLMSNNKIATATHNISAYRVRILGKNGAERMSQSCDDDGENKASERLLNMLVLMGVENIFVVISRWFGGIKLGPDRFKHINNTAKDAIIQCGWFPLKAIS